MESTRKIILLLALYLCQGIPFGFQATALPVCLRSSGVSLAGIGFASALALPWMLKPLWAPLVDRYWCARLGRRRTWLLPLQALLALCLAVTANYKPGQDLAILLGLVFLMNLVAATQDIAVDSLAVDLLTQEELGPGNAVQVAGYKTGMIIGGGMLLWLLSHMNWETLFIAMSLIAAFPLVLLTAYREKDPTVSEKKKVKAGFILFRALAFFRERHVMWAVLFILTYKTGEVAIDVMFKPFLVDIGFSAADIGLWVGTWGMGASLAGSILGGWMVKRTSIIKGLALALAARMVPLAMEWWLTMGQPGDIEVIITTLLEHLCGGMLTTAVFAFMMSMVDREIGATHYTFLAGIEVAGKAPAGWLSGLFAERLGYSCLFGLGLGLSLLVFIPLWFARTLPGGGTAGQSAESR